MDEGVIVLKNLICGYTINVFDVPKRVSGLYSTTYMALRLTHSPIRFVFSLDGHNVAFQDWLSPINIKKSEARTLTIEKAIIEWVNKHADFVFEKYELYVEKACDGSCASKICLQKPMLA